MLLRCCLTHLTVIMLRHILYLVDLSLCLGLGLFMSYLCQLCFIFSLIFIVIDHAHGFIRLKRNSPFMRYLFIEYQSGKWSENFPY